MSSNRELDFDGRLLDLHLGRLDEPEKQRVLQELRRDPALASQNEALISVFGALNVLRTDSVPTGFVDRVRRRIAAAETRPALRVVGNAPASGRRAEQEPFRWVLRAGNLRDLVAAAAMIVLAIGLGIPTMLHMRETNYRVACSANLARMGQGLAAYASTFNQALPFAGWGGWDSWQPTNNPQLHVVQNRQHLMPLLPAGKIDPMWLVCPSTRDIPPKSDQQVIDAANISYAYQNMAGVRPSLSDDPRLPILADDNPLFDDGRPLVELRIQLGVTDPASINSRAHGGHGQNVLTLGGRVIWSETPNVGVAGDNIWTLHNVRSYTGREGPVTSTDTHLLK